MPAFALALPAAAETADPAVTAARAWIAAAMAEQAFAYDDDWHGG